MPPPEALLQYFGNAPVEYEDSWIQDPRTSDCGYWCIWWLNQVSRGVDPASSVDRVLRLRDSGHDNIFELLSDVALEHFNQSGGGASLDDFQKLWSDPEVGMVGKAEWIRRMKALGHERKDAEDFYDSRTENQINKRQQTQPGEYYPIRSRTGEFGHLQMDLLDLITLKSPANRNNRYLLTAIDIKTRFAFAVPLTNKRATTVAKAAAGIFDKVDAMMKLVAKKASAPVTMVDVDSGEKTTETPTAAVWIETDNGNEFKGAFKALLKERGYFHEVNNVESTGQHTAMAIVERFHQTLNHRLRKIVSMSPKRKWIDKLDPMIRS